MKKNVKERIYSTIPDYWTYGIKIDKLIADLNELKAVGVEIIDIVKEEYDEESFMEFYLYKERLETDEEYAFRREKEKHNADYKKELELKELARLKAKYKDNEL